MYHPKVEKKKNHQFKVELQERINNRERERERERERIITFCFEENVRQITKLCKRRRVKEYSKENV